MEESLQKVNITSATPERGGLLRRMPTSARSFDLKKNLIPAAAIVVIILAGIGSGYVLANRRSTGPTTETELTGGAKAIQGPDEVGIKDEEVFRDTAQGRIKVNDNEKVLEGSHILIRPGGESQTANLTSSVLDLNQFVDKCVQVWGETFASQEAGWLMDVGRVKVLNSCPDGV